MFDGNFRESVDKVTTPVGKALHSVGVSADVITVLGVGMSLACGVAIATGNFFLGAVLLASTGIPDALDGAVAKASGSMGPRGAFFDSVSDRMSDGLMLLGAAWYFTGTSTPRLAVLPMAVLLVSILVSYERAKAEALGFDAKGGLMERAERFIVFGLGLFFASLFGAGVLTATLWIMLVLTTITVATRFMKVWKQATKVTPAAVPRRPREAPSADARRMRTSQRRAHRQERVELVRSRARERMDTLRSRK